MPAGSVTDPIPSDFPLSKKRGPKLAQCYGPRFLFRRKLSEPEEGMVINRQPC